jgi:deoxyribonuclease-4
LSVRFGFHVSIAGGFARAVDEALARKCETIQFFSRNPQGWRLKPLDSEDVRRFRERIRENGISPVTVHMPYLPNPASEGRELFEKSIAALVADMARAAELGAHYVIMHMGRRKVATEEQALARMIQAIDRALKRAEPSPSGASPPLLLLENTAGMGGSLGYRFEHLKTAIEGVESPNRLGVVLDTAHAFEAGYDFRTREGLDRTLREFDATVGLKRLCLLHLNDSKTEFGSRVDRHWHIGQGEIGKPGFRNIVNHPLLRHLPGIMETPRLSLQEDLRNMRAIRRLVEVSPESEETTDEHR